MTTRTYTSPFSQTNDATFRAWVAELLTEVIAAGMVQTADTGQINPATVLLPGTANTAAGYAILRTPGGGLYIKLEFGTGGSSGIPRMWATVGKGSDGAGNLVGVTSTRSHFTASIAPSSAVTAYPSYICVLDGHFGLVWKVNSNGNALHGGALVASVSVDSDGDDSEVGFGVFRMFDSSTCGFQCVRSAAPAAAAQPEASAGGFGIAIGNPVTSLTSDGKLQAYTWWMNVPEVLPFVGACTVLQSDMPFGASFPTTPVGTRERTYVSLPPASTTAGSRPGNHANNALAMLWE